MDKQELEQEILMLSTVIHNHLEHRCRFILFLADPETGHVRIVSDITNEDAVMELLQTFIDDHNEPSIQEIPKGN